MYEPPYNDEPEAQRAWSQYIGQTHEVNSAVLAPVLTEFLTS